MDIHDFTNRPTLQDIARKTTYTEGVRPTDHDISDALTDAGIDARDQNERERFVRLVRANSHGERVDAAGDSLEAARNQLGEEATEVDVLERAKLLERDKH